MDLYRKFLSHQKKIPPKQEMQRRTDILLQFIEETLHQKHLFEWKSNIKDILEYARKWNLKRFIWRDASIYTHLGNLCHAQNKKHQKNLITILEIIIGKKNIHEAKLPLDDISQISFSTRNPSEKITSNAFFRLPQTSTIFIYPKINLFRDNKGISSVTDYPQNIGPIETRLVQRNIKRSIDLLKLYSPALFKNFQSAVSSVVLLPRTSPAGSFNLGFNYFGGIFINPYSLPSFCKITEGLIHEYYHNCLWLYRYWAKPSGVPPFSVMITSPMTGNSVRAEIMLDALLIYISHFHFYSRLKSDRKLLTTKDRQFCKNKHQSLKHNIPLLINKLALVTRKKTDTWEYIQFLSNIFYQI